MRSKSEVKTININPTVAWKINEMVSVGGGFSAQRLDTTLSNAVSYRAVALASGVGPLIAATPLGAEGLATVEGDDWGWGWNIGVMFNLQPATRLGISYRSTIKYDVEGDVRFDNRPAAMGAVPQVANGDVKARIKLPDTWSVGVSHQLNPKVELLADYTWTGWDSIQDLVIKRSSGPLSGQTLTSTSLHFKNTWRIGIGGNYLLNDVWKLRAGFAYDNGNTSDEFRTPRLPDSDRLWFALGAQWTAGAQHGARLRLRLHPREGRGQPAAEPGDGDDSAAWQPGRQLRRRRARARCAGALGILTTPRGASGLRGQLLEHAFGGDVQRHGEAEPRVGRRQLRSLRAAARHQVAAAREQLAA